MGLAILISFGWLTGHFDPVSQLVSESGEGLLRAADPVRGQGGSEDGLSFAENF